MDMSIMLYGCSSLKYLPGIDRFDKYKTKNMCYMLNEYPSLISTQKIYKYTDFLEIIPPSRWKNGQF